MTASAPVESDGRFSVPAKRLVEDAYVNDPSVVEEFENVLSAVKVFAVYVFGIVVEEWMKALVVLLRNVVSRVSAPAEFVSPVPSRLLKDEPLINRFVVDAVPNDPYVVDENANVWLAVHELAFAMLRERVVFDPPSW